MHSQFPPRCADATAIEIVAKGRYEAPNAPDGFERLQYRSAVDGYEDWVLIRNPRRMSRWLVVLHGHNASGDQLLTRPDIRKRWWPMLGDMSMGVVLPNLRGNAWMGPAAQMDLAGLLHWLHTNHGTKQVILVGGSMGGTGTLTFTANHPQDVAAAVALCPATDVGDYHQWCRHGCATSPLLCEIADAIEWSYGGTPAKVPTAYEGDNVRKNHQKLVMPLAIVHGTADETIPVDQSRLLAERLRGRATFQYHEIQGGDHNAPLQHFPQALAWCIDALEANTP
ncbi:alpha/beta hydrolase family protein [Phycisphaerales bacterium AB-hyl4]|uniref:Alpha/beta hydrolase family protein n=1 Tax=Natronomicrosphaera hydrolytica TaxID=3242702 RepID=A0ABV4U555_9BACT